MKLTLYESADSFLNDNKNFITQNSLQADLMYGNAHSALTKANGFYGASVKYGNEIMLSSQIASFPRVHFSNCVSPSEMADRLVQNYIEKGNIPLKINGDKNTVDAVVKAMENHSIKYNLDSELYKRKCSKLVDIPTLSLKITNAKNLDFDFSEFYYDFCKECNITVDWQTAKEKSKKIKSEGNLYLLKDGSNIVTIAASSRKTEGGRAISLVYTPPEYRKKGYSTCCVKQLTEIILKDNNYAFLYSDKSNPVSNHEYERLGFEIIEEFHQYKKSDT